jgi:hypothetical protein
MRDTRFDGKKIYKYAAASQAVFDIRGSRIAAARRCAPCGCTCRGAKIHKVRSASQAVYEIR